MSDVQINAEIEVLSRRLDALARRNRLLGGALVALLLCAVVVASDSPGGPQELVRARHIQLVDDQGRPRAELAIDSDGSAGLFVRDQQGRLRATVTHDEQRSALFLWVQDGTVRLGAAQFAHGGGGFALHGANAKGAAALYYKEGGSLTFYDTEGKVIQRTPAPDEKSTADEFGKP